MMISTIVIFTSVILSQINRVTSQDSACDKLCNSPYKEVTCNDPYFFPAAGNCTESSTYEFLQSEGHDTTKCIALEDLSPNGINGVKKNTCQQASPCIEQFAAWYRDGICAIPDMQPCCTTAMVCYLRSLSNTEPLREAIKEAKLEGRIETDSSKPTYHPNCATWTPCADCAHMANPTITEHPQINNQTVEGIQNPVIDQISIIDEGTVGEENSKHEEQNEDLEQTDES